MKIRVGIVAVETWGGGIVYTHNLVRSLALLPPDERPHITLFYESDPREFESLFPLVDAHVQYRPGLAESGRLKIWQLFKNLGIRVFGFLLGEAALDLALAARKAEVNVMFPIRSAYSRMIPNPITWIPDFQHRALPKMFKFNERALRNLIFKRILNRSGNLILSSNHAFREAVGMSGNVKPRTHILHFTTIPKAQWYLDSTAIRLKYSLPDKYLMVSNQFWTHKDHKTLLKALAILIRRGKDIYLVCTGELDDRRNPGLIPSIMEQIRKDDLKPFVSLLGKIQRDEQMQLMRSAEAVVQPSLYEGWSTVLEDARTLGVPVIVSDFPVHY